MNDNERYIARVLFKNKVFRSDGQAYEDLFTSVMVKSNSEFSQVKPQGSIGDHKNDGFDRTTGTYFQCYAPEDLEANEKKSLSKLKTDFDGLIKNWNHEVKVKKFFYVLNDKYKGCYPTVVHALNEIKQKHGLEDCKVFLNKDLETLVFQLEASEIYEILGSVPAIDIPETIQMSALSEVVDHLIKNMKALTSSGKLVAPDF